MKKSIVISIIHIILALLIIVSSENAFAKTEIPEDAYGVIWIPCLNVKMPVYTSSVNDHDHRQAVIDNEQSALINNWGTAMYIADHAFSEDANGNEWNIQKIFCGAYAWLYTHNGNYFLECYMTGKTDYDGNEYICGRLVTPCSSHDLMLTCCAEDSSHHFVAVFRRLSEF